MITALISATGTAERTEVNEQHQQQQHHQHPRWAAALFKRLKVEILSGSISVHALQVKLVLTPTLKANTQCYDSCLTLSIHTV